MPQQILQPFHSAAALLFFLCFSVSFYSVRHCTSTFLCVTYTEVMFAQWKAQQNRSFNCFGLSRDAEVGGEENEARRRVHAVRFSPAAEALPMLSVGNNKKSITPTDLCFTLYFELAEGWAFLSLFLVLSCGAFCSTSHANLFHVRRPEL